MDIVTYVTDEEEYRMGLLDKMKKLWGQQEATDVPSDPRRIRTHKKMEELGIAICPWLPLLENSDEVSLKGVDEVCHRAIASLLVIQIACDIGKDDEEESVKLFSQLLEKFGVRDNLNATEQKLLDGTYSEQDVTKVAWTYEAYWSLVWALGLIDDIMDASVICDCKVAIDLVNNCETYDEFKGKCKIRDIEEILDMLDIYYNYDWACTEQRIRPKTKIGKLNPDVVSERRRGLEWLISEEDDWFVISLDT